MKKWIAVVVFAAFFFAGCASTPKIDWDSRIGNFTYDQAVLELGPPDKEEQLTDKTRVADWITYRSRSSGFWAPRAGYGWVQTTDSPWDYYLRLTFDPNGKLQSWKKYAK